MESSITQFLLRQRACERLPTKTSLTHLFANGAIAAQQAAQVRSVQTRARPHTERSVTAQIDIL